MNIYEKLNENLLKQIDKVKIGDIKIDVVEALSSSQSKHRPNVVETLIAVGELTQIFIEIGENLFKRLSVTSEMKNDPE